MKTDPQFRCSEIVHLIARARTKTPALTKSAQSYLRDMWLRQNCNYNPRPTSKQMQKGIEVEDASLNLYAKIYRDGKPLYKNEQRITAEFEGWSLTGECDAKDLDENAIVEIKSCYDPHSYIQADLTKQYWAQVQAYLYLFGFEKAYLAYTLIDLPEHLYQREEAKYCYQNEIIDPSAPGVQDQLFEHRLQFIYSGNELFPEEKRIKRYAIEKDPDFEAQLAQGAELALEYWKDIDLNQLI